MSVLHINHESFEKIIAQDGKTVLVDFWATWCGPCRMIAPVLEEVAKERPDVTVCKVDVDEERDLALEYGVSSIPTLLVFRDGKLVGYVLINASENAGIYTSLISGGVPLEGLQGDLMDSPNLFWFPKETRITKLRGGVQL